MRRSPILPIVLALATFALLALALWPQEEPVRTVVVAARDLGAGTILAPSDLKTISVPLEQAPDDGVDEPTLLVGESLSVVRYTGEPITPRHLGPAVILAPDERGIAVTVQADTGLAGLLRPGMEVGVIATLRDDLSEQVYAKSALEGLRVLYVPPDFQARNTSIVYQTNPDGSYTPPPAPPEPIREGVIVLAAGTLPEPVVFEESQVILIRRLAEEEGESGAEIPTVDEPPDAVWAVPVELLAALNAADASFTLVLTPEDALPYTSPGLDLNVLLGVEE